MVLGAPGQKGAFLIKYYDVDEQKMPIRDGEWYLARASGIPNIWIRPCTGKAVNHEAALFLLTRTGVAEDDIELCKAVHPPSKVLKPIEVFKIYTNGFASIGKAESLHALWEQIKALIKRSEDQAYVELASLNEYRMAYTVADPTRAYPRQNDFPVEGGIVRTPVAAEARGDATDVL